MRSLTCIFALTLLTACGTKTPLTLPPPPPAKAAAAAPIPVPAPVKSADDDNAAGERP